MKTNKMMRIASVLLVAVLLTTCVISGTFAKYVTTISVTDAARVAYWGFDQAAITEFELFDQEATNISALDEIDPTGNDKLIAPGTTGNATFAFGYTNYKTDDIVAPEVPYTFTVDATITGDYDSLDANTSFYWTLQKGTDAATNYQTVAELLAAIKALSGDASGTKDYTAGTLPTAFSSADEVYTIGWVWDFDGPADDYANDAADTAMGNSQTLENVTVTISVTATQKD